MGIALSGGIALKWELCCLVALPSSGNCVVWWHCLKVGIVLSGGLAFKWELRCLVALP